MLKFSLRDMMWCVMVVSLSAGLISHTYQKSRLIDKQHGIINKLNDENARLKSELNGYYRSHGREWKMHR